MSIDVSKYSLFVGTHQNHLNEVILMCNIAIVLKSILGGNLEKLLERAYARCTNLHIYSVVHLYVPQISILTFGIFWPRSDRNLIVYKITTRC